MLRERTDRAWFSRLLHLVRKWSGSILTTPKPTWGKQQHHNHITESTQQSITVETWNMQHLFSSCISCIKQLINIVVREKKPISFCNFKIYWKISIKLACCFSNKSITMWFNSLAFHLLCEGTLPCNVKRDKQLSVRDKLVDTYTSGIVANRHCQ